MKQELPKTYAPAEFEDRLYKMWEDSGAFLPDPDQNKPSFSVVIPPPNVTGQLHMGHALDETLQDIIIRTKRMQGYSTLWVPGTDHAGIATQIKVEEVLRKEKGLSRHDIGREEFLKLVWDWKEKYGNRITGQLRKLGSSCDWSREAFTMSDSLSVAVRRVFVSLYEKGLIYRGQRIINQCPHCNTALSDAEVEHKDTEGAFWHIRYPVKGEDRYVIVATTRPETMLGDSAVAVNPEDERYQDLIGKTLILPLVGREIPVVADEAARTDFGTGCVKITPAHDPNDFETGQRHQLPIIQVIDTTGHIKTDFGTKYEGMDRFEAREAIVADLEAAGYLVKVEKTVHAVAHCYRCGTAIEPLASLQWFVKMKPLAEPAIAAVKEGKIRYIPDRFSKIYLNWMENIRDWCISRQLWWGHRIPAYYCDDCGEITVAEDAVTVCPKCGGTHIRQDEDVLDTWFSSALWPFTTLGWPEKTADLERYYPTSVLVTGYDIITFWVSKMIFMGIENMKEIPFPHVFIHGLVRDSQGRKMSKSLGNGIDPLEVIDRYGADALRFALVTGNSPGNDMRYSEEKIESARNFANKLWNAARFVLMNLETEDVSLPDEAELAPEDKWILTRLSETAENAAANIEKYELGVALASIYDFIWDVFCDWYIELAKPRLQAKGTPENLVCQRTIVYVLDRILRLLHPFMPFITEEIFQALPHGEGEMILTQPYPAGIARYPEEAARIEKLIAVIRGIRTRRAEMNVPSKTRTAAYLITRDSEAFAEPTHIFFERLAGVNAVTLTDKAPAEDSVSIVTDAATVYIPLRELVDLEAEKKRLTEEAAKTDAEIARAEGMLSNSAFVSKAPAAVVNSEKEKLEKLRIKRKALAEALEKL